MNMRIIKIISLGVIFLFIGVSIAPSINANIDRKLPRIIQNAMDEDIVEITVSEYKPDGSIEKSVVVMPRVKAKELREELKYVKDKEVKLSIYKKYNLVPQDVTCEQLRVGMEEKAQRLDFPKQRFENSPSSFGEGFIVNFFCYVDTFLVIGIALMVGLSFITSRINFWLALLSFVLQLDLPSIPSVDVMDVIFGSYGQIRTTDGLWRDKWIEIGPMFCQLLGFVGYSFRIPTIEDRGFQFIGYSACVLGMGIPRDVYPWAVR